MDHDIPEAGGGLLHHEGTSIPKVTGSNPAVARQVFQPAQCGLHSE